MKASELIKLLQSAIEKYGDENVEVNTCDNRMSDEPILVRRTGDTTTWFEICPKQFAQLDDKDFVIA